MYHRMFCLLIFIIDIRMSTLQSVLSSLRPTVVALIAAAGLSILRTVVFGEHENGFGYISIG